MNEVVDFARKYRAIGWQVIPLFNYSKNPAPIRWKDYQEKWMSDEEFERLFNLPNITGVGVITGKISGIVVLDEDTYKEGGIPVAVRTGMMAQSARGGRHHFFKYVEPIKSSGLREGIYVEIKADGGFLVLPPTQVIVDGEKKSYTWVDKCMPEEMMEIRESALTPYRAGGASDSKALDLVNLVHAPLGVQHNNLRSFSLAVLNRFSQKEWDIAAEVIRRQAELFDPPHPEDRVEKMIKDCMKFIQEHPKDVEKEIENEVLHPHSIDDLVEERWADKELEKIAPSTGWPELDDHIGGFVPGHIATFTGDTNVGKTTIACNFAEALRRQSKKVLYIALEPDTVVVDYLASVRLRKSFRNLEKDDLYVRDQFIKVFKQGDIKTPNDLVQALRGIQEHFDLIVIDHIGYFVHSEQNYIQQQSNIIKELAFLSKEFKTCVMMIAHLRKPGFQKKNQDWVPTQNDISGSAAFKQDSQEVLIAYRPIVEGSMGTKYEDRGKLLVTKTKHEGGNGVIELLFTAGSAKVWSLQEAENSLEGQLVLRERSHGLFQSNMQQTGVFEKEVDTGNDST